MPEPTETPVVEVPTDEQPGAPSDVFSREYVEKLRSEAADWRKKYRDVETEQKALKQKELEEAGKWQEIAAQREAELERLSAIKETYDGLLTSIEERNKSRVERVPQELRSLVPPLPPLELASWLDANDAVLSKPQAVSIGASAGNGDRPTGSASLTEAQRQAARRMGVTEEDYLAQLKKR
jgi:DNA repair exonuclease SbcCD ATPase subunit